MVDLPENIGPYQITRELGRGGMGVVYLGRDTRLDRDVAIKVLPANFAANADRLSRFEREAKTLAQLNHPNIAGIYGVEEDGGQRYLILEFVEGESLADRLDRGPLPVDEAIEIAVQIAAGVEAAHEAGVVHRDLKPGNVIITPDDKAVVLDFGLARLEDSSASSTDVSSPATADSPTVVAPTHQHSPTMPGVILGTAAYMSPEQARGRRVDKRSDIWSFGVVLYEMLTGASPFVGETFSDSIGAILHKDPKLDCLPPGTPPHVRNILRRCLERDKSIRYRDIGDVRIEMLHGSKAIVAGGAPHRAGIGAVIATAIVVGMLCAVAAWFLKPAPDQPAVEAARVSIMFPWDRDLITHTALSPQGDMLACIVEDTNAPDGAFSIHLRRLDDMEFQRIHAMENRPFGLAFTPDGEDLILTARSESMHEYVSRLPIDGGRPVPLLDAPEDTYSMIRRNISWLNDDEFVLHGDDEDRNQVYAVSRRDGSVRPLITLPVDPSARQPDIRSIAPDGGVALVLLGTIEDDGFRRSAHTLDLTTGTLREFAPNASDAAYASSDIVVLTINNECFATRIDPGSGQRIGELVPLVEGAEAFASSRSGSAVYMPKRPRSGSLATIDAEGRSVSLSDDRRNFQPIVLGPSPDGTSVAVQYVDRQRSGRTTLAVVELASGRMRIVDSGTPFPLMWLPDGRLAYLEAEAEQTGEVISTSIRIWEPSGNEVLRTNVALRSPVCALTADASHIIYGRFPETEEEVERLPDNVRSYLAILDVREPGFGEVLIAAGEGAGMPALSPDNAWLAFRQWDRGQSDIYVAPFQLGEPIRPVRVSVGSGFKPFWSNDGSTLFYGATNDWQTVGDVMKVTVDPTEENGFSAPEVALPARILRGRNLTNWDFIAPLPDGTFAYIDTVSEESDGRHMHLVINWLDEVRRQLSE